MKQVAVVKGEVRRTVEEAKNYWLQTITNIISTIIFFLGFSFVISPDLRGSDLFLLVSMLLWYFSLEIINQMSHYILEEKYFGTIEKIFLSPYGPVTVLSYRAFSSILLSTGIVSVMYLGLSLIVGISPFSITLPMILISIVTLAGLYGFGLMLAGLTLLSSRTSSVSSIITYVMLFISGMLVPLDQFHPVIAAIARLFPLTNGVEMLRVIATSNMDLLGFILNINTYFGIVYSIVAIIAGILVFKYAVRRAKIKGVLRSV